MEKLHNISIKYDFDDIYLLRKAKRKISGSLLPIYIWESYYADHWLSIYLLGMIKRRLIYLSTLHGNIGR